MKKRTRKTVARYHDRVAGRYDAIYSDAYWRWHDTLTWDYLKPHLPRVQSEPIVDLGCGSGKWGIKLAQSGFHVTCVDISIQMIEVVRRKAHDTAMDDKVQCVQADLMDLSSLPAEHFELAVALGEPLCSTESPHSALKQIRRILKPGGRLVATVDNRLHAMEHYLEKTDLDGLEQFIQTGRTHWLTRDPSERFELHTFSPAQISKLIEKSGFEMVERRGKTILPMRHYQQWLEDPPTFRRLLQIEKELSRDSDTLGRAPHIQFVARKIT